MGKNFNQEVADLKSGLVTIENIIKSSTTNRKKHNNAILNKEIQVARIDFFVKGYNLCKGEIKEQ